MSEQKEFQARVQRIGDLLAGLEKFSNPEERASAKALVQSILDLHAAGFEQSLEIISKHGEAGQAAIDELGCDPLVSGLLLLYGLHPLSIEDRVAQAIDKVTPQVGKAGGEVTLLELRDRAVRLHIRTSTHACASTGAGLKKMVEDALNEAAPDLEQIIVEGLEERSGAEGFVPLAKLGGFVGAMAEAEP